MNDNVRYCKLVGCNNLVINWRRSCCSRSHQATYSAKVRHGTQDLPNKSPAENKQYQAEWRKFNKTFVGPRKPKSLKPTVIKTVNVTTQKSRAQRKSEWSAYVVARRKKRDKSMPNWADKEKILAFYVEAQRLTVETGIQYEVDHIIPSNHKLVCGLHCEQNLQILPRSENRQKSNNFGMFK